MFHKIMKFKLKGADTYYNHGSTWIILTDKKQWVIELTKDGTLWYNYYFFQSILIGLMGFEDTVKNQNYITEWVENFIQNGVKYTRTVRHLPHPFIEDTIQNGVKSTSWDPTGKKSLVEDTIQNGVKETHRDAERHPKTIEDAIQNGVKKTYSDKIPHEYDWSNQFTEEIDDIIQNGVKHTEKSLQIDGSCVIEDVIKEGVKHTEYGDWLDGDERFDDIIKNGVKETWGYEKQPQVRVNEVIRGEIKEINWRRVDNHPTYLDNIINSTKL